MQTVGIIAEYNPFHKGHAYQIEEAKKAAKAEENEDTITLPIVINESKEITDSATVKLLSAKFEENEIRNFQNISQYYTTIPHYEKYFDNDGSLNSDYVFAELNIGITSQKSWDDLYLTSFNLEYIYNGQYGSCEPKFIDNCIDFEDPHKQSTVAIKADEMNEISIGYILPKEEFESLIMEYLPVTAEQIQEYAVFDEKNQTYVWVRLGCLNYAPTFFGTSLPEVIDIKENEDGTVTLTVDAVCDMVICDDAVITHELTVKFADDGSFQYLGNEILDDGIMHIPDYQYRIKE